MGRHRRKATWSRWAGPGRRPSSFRTTVARRHNRLESRSTIESHDNVERRRGAMNQWTGPYVSRRRLLKGAAAVAGVSALATPARGWAQGDKKVVLSTWGGD